MANLEGFSKSVGIHSEKRLPSFGLPGQVTLFCCNATFANSAESIDDPSLNPVLSAIQSTVRHAIHRIRQSRVHLRRTRT